MQVAYKPNLHNDKDRPNNSLNTLRGETFNFEYRQADKVLLEYRNKKQIMYVCIILLYNNCIYKESKNKVEVVTDSHS